MSYFIGGRGAQGYNFPGNGYGLKLAYSNDDTLSVSAGEIILPNRQRVTIPATNVTFASLDTGSRAIGDYALFAMAGGLVLTRIETSHSGAGLRPSVAAADASDCALLGYFHNGAKADGTVGAARNQAIFPYSVSNNTLLNMANPYRALIDLPAGVPLPGMVKIGPLSIGIYQMSREDATASAAGSSAYPTSRYGVVPWAGINGWTTMAVLRNSGLRLPTWEEWLGCVEFQPGTILPATMNGNTASGASSDDATQSGTADPTQAGRTLTGTGPRTTEYRTSDTYKTGRSWYSPAGIADPVGNVWEWVAQFFGGLKTSSPGSSVAWGSNGDSAYNFQGQAFNPDTGGFTEGLPALLIVGGDWNAGASAGVRAAYAGYAPTGALTGIGARAAR